MARSEFPETVKPQGARHMGSTVLMALGLGCGGEREAEREKEREKRPHARSALDHQQIQWAV